MNATDCLGTVGVFLILTAYFLNLFGKIKVSDNRFILLNLVGALMSCAASVLLNYLPFVILEGVWAGVSLFALLRKTVKKTPELAENKNLSELIRQMSPEIVPGRYVFVSTDADREISEKEIFCSFREKEGISLILKKEFADQAGFTYDFCASWITLNVFSSLDAVGFTAAFSGELGREGISCNVVAGFYHDHIFVNEKDEAKTMDILTKFSQKS